MHRPRMFGAAIASAEQKVLATTKGHTIAVLDVDPNRVLHPAFAVINHALCGSMELRSRRGYAGAQACGCVSGSAVS
jgi:hypothetical protein